jgi:hypothetical protein
MKERSAVYLLTWGFVVWASVTVRAQVPASVKISAERKGTVYAMARQSDGRLIIGGNFDIVNGEPRVNLARFNADGSLDENWNPCADSVVYAVDVTGTNIFVGGAFRNVGGAARDRIAKLDYYTGKALSNAWTVGADSTVRAITHDANRVYIGGQFSQIGGYSRTRLAKAQFDGTIDPNFTNTANDTVHDLFYYSDIYAAGEFTEIGGESRNYLAKLHYFNGMALSWDPSPNYDVYSIDIHSGNLYIGGIFNRVGTTYRDGVAKINTTSGAVDSFWNPTIAGNYYIYTIDADLHNVCFGGIVTNVNGTAVDRLARVDAVNGTLDPLWTNYPDASIRALYVNSSNVFVGGSFSKIGDQWRHAVARLQTNNGMAQADYPSMASIVAPVYSLAPQADGSMILGGSFSSINGKVAPYIARVDADGVLDTNWSCEVDSSVKKILPYDTNLYIAGSFSEVAGQPVERVARIATDTGHLLPTWTNRVGSWVEDMAWDQYNLYVGGGFTSVNGRGCRYLARFSHSDQQWDSSWLTAVSSTVFAVDTDSSYLYAGGGFRQVGSVAISNLCRIDKGAATLDAGWNPQVNGWVQSVLLDGGNLYIGGTFSSINGEYRDNAAKVIRSSASVDPAWDAGLWGGYVETVALYSNWVYLGGSFMGVNGGDSFPNLVRVAVSDGEADMAWDASPDGGVYALVPQGADDCWIGGLFLNCGGMHRHGVALLEPLRIGKSETICGIPAMIWRGGSNDTYTIDCAESLADGFVMITNNWPGVAETNVFTDPDRLTYTQACYRITRE